jgi:UDP-glucose 4-epimerase
MKNVSPKILVTGGTGFVGKSVVPLLRQIAEVHVVSRGKKTEVQGDLSLWGAGLDIQRLKKEKYDLFLHMAGLYDLKASRYELQRQNVQGTHVALNISDQLGIPVFVNTSTVAAAVNSVNRVVLPNDLNFSQSFPDDYAESKALAEKLIQNWNGQHQLKLNLRLGIVVGDSEHGQIDRIDGPYSAAKAFDRIKSVLELLPFHIPLPGDTNVRIPLVPVNSIASAIVKMCDWALFYKQDGNETYHSFHLTPKDGLDVQSFYRSHLKFRFIKNKGIRLVSQLPNEMTIMIAKKIFQFPEEQLRYLLKMPNFNSESARKILGDHWCPEFSDYEIAYWSGYEKFIQNR